MSNNFATTTGSRRECKDGLDIYMCVCVCVEERERERETERKREKVRVRDTQENLLNQVIWCGLYVPRIG